MIWLALLLTAPLAIMALLVRSARCRLCKTAAASRLVGMLLLWAAQLLVNEVGGPGPVVQFVAGMAVAAVVLEPLPRALSRWLHTGPRCAAVSADRASGHPHHPDQPPTTGPAPPRPSPPTTPRTRNEDA